MSEGNHLLRIDHLRLQNFRCFAACKLNLHPTLTVLVAENAQGKTALLDALRLALQVFVAMIWRGSKTRGFEQTDIHLTRGDQDHVMEPRLPCQFSVDGEIDGELVTWGRALSKDSHHPRASTKDTNEIRRIARRLAEQSDIRRLVQTDSSSVLPVVAYYGTGRLYDERRLSEGKRWLAETSPGRFSAYLDCLSPSSSYKAFSAWFGQKWEQVSDPRFRAVGFEARPENHITAVRDAVSTVLEPTGWTTIVWEPAIKDDGRILRPGYIALEHSLKGRLPLTHLSDGVRNMVALVGDLTHRCVGLNPFLGEDAAKRTPGIVLIDEVEMHLHPRWQQLVVGLLSSAFPCVQFVMSTHSPQVLTTLTRDSIRMLDQNDDGGWSSSCPAEETKGVENSTVMNDVMGVNPVPPVPEAGWRDDYTALIETGVHETAEGMKLRAKLAALYGDQHPIILDFERLIRFQAFKRRKSQPLE